MHFGRHGVNLGGPSLLFLQHLLMQKKSRRAGEHFQFAQSQQHPHPSSKAYPGCHITLCLALHPLLTQPRQSSNALGASHLPPLHPQVVGTAALWGAVTAVGEIPPYAFSYHAAKAGLRNEEWDTLFQESETRPQRREEGLARAVVHSMKKWMLRFIKRCASCEVLLQ